MPKLVFLGAEVRNVPGAEYIRVEQDPESESGYSILIKFVFAEDPLRLGLREMAEFAQALSAVQRAAADMASEARP